MQGPTCPQHGYPQPSCVGNAKCGENPRGGCCKLAGRLADAQIVDNGRIWHDLIWIQLKLITKDVDQFLPDILRSQFLVAAPV